MHDIYDYIKHFLNKKMFVSLLFHEAMILYSFLLQFDAELTFDISVKNLDCKGVCFLFEFISLKSLVTKQKVRTKFVKIAQYDFTQYF